MTISKSSKQTYSVSLVRDLVAIFFIFLAAEAVEKYSKSDGSQDTEDYHNYGHHDTVVYVSRIRIQKIAGSLGRCWSTYIIDSTATGTVRNRNLSIIRVARRCSAFKRIAVSCVLPDACRAKIGNLDCSACGLVFGVTTCTINRTSRINAFAGVFLRAIETQDLSFPLPALIAVPHVGCISVCTLLLS